MPLGRTTGAQSTPVVLANDVAVQVTLPAVNVDTGALVNVTNATTTQFSADQTNANYRGLILVCNVSAIAAGTIAVSVQGKDLVSGAYYTLFTGAAVATAILTTYQVYPGSTPAVSSFNGPLPTTWRVMVTAVNALPVTYTVSATLIG